MSAEQRPGDIVPQQKRIEEVIDKRIATITKSGFLPDYANGSYRTIDSAHMSNKVGPYSFTQVVTPTNGDGWTLVQVAFDLSAASLQAQASLIADPDDTFVQLDHFVISNGDITVFLSGMIPPGLDYGINIDLADSACHGNVGSIFEIPPLA